MNTMRLKIGDLICDDGGSIGKVVGFYLDGVIVRWEYKETDQRFTENDLKRIGAVRVEGQ